MAFMTNSKFPMANPNQGRERHAKALREGQRMGQIFAANRCPETLHDFLKNNDLVDDLYELYQSRINYSEGQVMTKDQFMLHLVDDLKISFGQTMALSYALGYVDHASGLRPKDFKDATKETQAPPETGVQLVLPGIE